MEIKQIPTGIEGVDEILNGGIPENSNILLKGSFGAGKTVFCWQFLYKGALERKEPGLFVTLGERPDDLRKWMLSFGWDIKKLEEKNLISIIDAFGPSLGLPSKEKYTESEVTDIESLTYTIHQVTEETKAKRIVIDSLSDLALQIESKKFFELLYRLNLMLLEINAIVILTTQFPEGPYKFLTPAESLSQGIIELGMIQTSQDIIRSFSVIKMRGIKFKMGSFLFHITEKGIIVYPKKTISEKLKGSC